jgi:hypothetical protein
MCNTDASVGDAYHARGIETAAIANRRGHASFIKMSAVIAPSGAATNLPSSGGKSKDIFLLQRFTGS